MALIVFCIKKDWALTSGAGLDKHQSQDVKE